MYPHIHFDIHLRQHIKPVQYVYFVILKATERRMAHKAIIVYPHIQLFQGYSFEVEGYSVVTESWELLRTKNSFNLENWFQPLQLSLPLAWIPRSAPDKQTSNNIFTFLINNTADLVIESQIHHQNPHPKSP